MGNKTVDNSKNMKKTVAADYVKVSAFAKMAGLSTQRIYQMLGKDLVNDCIDIDGRKFINTNALQRFLKGSDADLTSQNTDLPSSLSNDLPSSSHDLPRDLPSNLHNLPNNEELVKSLQERICDLQKQIEILEAQLLVKDEQIKVKDTQIATLQAHTDDLTATLTSMQNNIQTLTDALSIAQKLHAGTIQGQLQERAERVDTTSEVVPSAAKDVTQPKHWWQKNRKKKHD